MSTRTETDFVTIAQERGAVKQFDPSYKMSKEEVEELLQTANLAPSSWNLQHWKYIAILDQATKEKLLPIAFGQKQVAEASVVIAILGDLQANLNAEAVYTEVVNKGSMTEEIKNTLIGQIESAYTNVPNVPRDEAIRNASLAAMQLMLAARAKGLDSCPMGGYDAQAFAKEFNVPERYLPVMLLPIGKASSPAHPSSRFPVGQTVVWNSF